MFKKFFLILSLIALANQSIAGSKIYFVHSDHLGTPQKLTDEAKDIVWSVNQTPFGETSVDNDPDGDGKAIDLNIRFPGQYFDVATGLHYNYFRDYDPTLGRYIQSDPIGLAGGINTYAYAGNSPLRYIDPFGLEVVNNSDYPVQFRDENWKPYTLPPHSKTPLSPDGVRNPLTGEWTKYRGKDWLPSNDVNINPDGTNECVGGACYLLPEPMGPDIDKTFGGDDKDFDNLPPGQCIE